MRLLVTICLASTACRYTGAFQCEMDTDCRSRGALGRCQLDTGFCTFNDSTCPSGFRYDDSAGAHLAGSCSEPPVVDDAGVVDASTFDPETCPASFTQTLSNVPKARYQVLPGGAGIDFGEQVLRCEMAAPGSTHAVIVDSPAKASALAQFIAASNTARVYIGLVQSPSASTVGGDWISLTGAPVVASLWATADTEPDDADGNENHLEQAGAFGSRGLYDVPATSQYPLVCECDGRRSTNEALAYVGPD